MTVVNLFKQLVCGLKYHSVVRSCSIKLIYFLLNYSMLNMKLIFFVVATFTIYTMTIGAPAKPKIKDCEDSEKFVGDLGIAGLKYCKDVKIPLCQVEKVVTACKCCCSAIGPEW